MIEMTSPASTKADVAQDFKRAARTLEYLADVFASQHMNTQAMQYSLV